MGQLARETFDDSQNQARTAMRVIRNARRQLAWLGAAAALSLAAAGCGGSDSPTGPSDGGSGTVATITITSTGVSPSSVTVAPGSRVTFVNSDNRPHEPASDPHPTHGSCPPIDQVGFIAAGQSRTSGNLNTTGTCSYHDHLNDGDARLRGTIRVQ
jgi:plastocyanin